MEMFAELMATRFKGVGTVEQKRGAAALPRPAGRWTPSHRHAGIALQSAFDAHFAGMDSRTNPDRTSDSLRCGVCPVLYPPPNPTACYGLLGSASNPKPAMYLVAFGSNSSRSV